MKKRLFVAMSISMMVFLSAGGAYAFNPVDLQTLKTKNECNKCDLSGANLTGAKWIDKTICKEGSIGQVGGKWGTYFKISIDKDNDGR